MISFDRLWHFFGRLDSKDKIVVISVLLRFNSCNIPILIHIGAVNGPLVPFLNNLLFICTHIPNSIENILESFHLDQSKTLFLLSFKRLQMDIYIFFTVTSHFP